MTHFERLAARIDSFRDRMVDMQIKLGSIPAISPASGGEGEAEKAATLLEFLEDIGFDDIQVIKVPDFDVPAGFRPNILASVKGRDDSKTIWIMTHMDTVPPGELALWSGNPFKPWVEEGKIYGRGVEDNQQDLIASLFALKAFREEKILPNFDVGLAIFSDEETGNTNGLQYVLEHSNPFRQQDLIIVPDAGNRDGTKIEVAEKSILWLKFTTYGKQAHGSTPEKGINSFKAASYLVTELNGLYGLFPDINELFDPPISTFEPTKKETNVPNINTIPGEDVFYLDCRILSHYSVDDVKNRIEDFTQKIEHEFGVSILIEDVQNAPAPPPTSADAPVVIALKRAVKEIYGKEARPTGIGGGTIAALFRRKNYQAAGWAKIDETAHQPNEYCLIDNMIGDAKVFAHIFLQ